MSVAIIDYGSGNIRSVCKAFEKAAAGGKVVVTSNPADLMEATHIVLPGVGAFKDCMNGLTAITGMVDALELHVLGNKTPFFGICVGMQLLADYGLEFGKHKGLGWIGGEVAKLELQDKSLKIPHMGWNDIKIRTKPSESGHMFNNIAKDADFYFVHSYHLCTEEKKVAATAFYGQEIVAAVQRGNIFGTQFHPEKSQQNGLQLIKNFLKV